MVSVKNIGEPPSTIWLLKLTELQNANLNQFYTCNNRKKAWRDWKLKATAEERFQRLAADRIYRKERRDTEDEQERSQRLDALKTYTKKRRDNETEEERSQRQAADRINTKESRDNETEEERSQRQQNDELGRLMEEEAADRINTKESRDNETEEERTLRLESKRANEANRRENETESRRSRRLKDLSERDEQRRAQESLIDKQRRLESKRKNAQQKRQGREFMKWRSELIDKASLNYICTSECRYRPKASMTEVIMRGNKKTFNMQQIGHLTLNEETRSLDGKFYVCKHCKDTIKKNKTPSCNEKKHNFIIPGLPEELKTPEMRLNRLEAHLLKLIIPFIRIAHIPGTGGFKIKGGMITVEANVNQTMDKVLVDHMYHILLSISYRLSYYFWKSINKWRNGGDLKLGHRFCMFRFQNIFCT